jgi:hypothetical protein
MTTIDMTQVIAKANELNNSTVELNKAFKRIASVKTRLKQSAGRPDFNEKMTAALQEEQLLKHVRAYLTSPRKTVNDLDADDIAAMDYDEVCRAIKSIQSKKTHTKWADDCMKDKDGMFIPGSGAMYKEACRIEQMLLERKHELKPNSAGFSKAALREFIADLRVCSDLDVATCLDRIEAFMDGGEL